MHLTHCEFVSFVVFFLFHFLFWELQFMRNKMCIMTAAELSSGVQSETDQTKPSRRRLTSSPGRT